MPWVVLCRAHIDMLLLLLLLQPVAWVTDPADHRAAADQQEALVTDLVGQAGWEQQGAAAAAVVLVAVMVTAHQLPAKVGATAAANAIIFCCLFIVCQFIRCAPGRQRLGR